MSENNLTGYPSIDKPWLKYYSEEAINAPLPKMTMYQYIWENNKNNLSDIALRFYGTKITYDKLFKNIQSAAKAFCGMGVREGDIVTIMSLQTPETITAIYALNYLGAVANMVYMTLSEKEIVNTLKNTNSKLFLVLDAALERVEAIKSEIDIPVVVLSVADSMPSYMKIGYAIKTKATKHNFLRWADFLKRSEGMKLPLAANDHTALAIIVYTSGTTGEPKGVMLSNFNFNAVALQYKYSGISFERSDSMLVFMPPFLSIGFSLNVHMPLSLGLILDICVNPEPSNVWSQFLKDKPNHFVAAPSNLIQIMEHNTSHLEYIKTFAAGGDCISIDDERKINHWLKNGGSFAKYICGYGMTEFAATVTTGNNHANKEGTMGIPLVKCNVKVLDSETHEELSYGETGELYFNSPSQMIGYVNQPENPFKEINGEKWICTGDLGYIDEDGFIHYIGRIKRIYLSKGNDGTLYKIFPQRIEECFENDPMVELCGVITKEVPERLHITIAFVKLKVSTDLSEKMVAALTELANRELPEHSRPESIHILKAMPMTPSGKIDYQKLEKIAEERPTIKSQ